MERSQFKHISVGTNLEPLPGTSVLPPGLYQVAAIDGDDIQLSRLHRNEDGNLATTARLSWIARSQLGLFRQV